MSNQNRELFYQDEQHEFSEGEVVMQYKTPDTRVDELSSSNNNYIYASNESLDREYLTNAKDSDDVYTEIPKQRTKSPANLQTSLNSTLSASNFITPEKLMEKLELKSKDQQLKQQSTHQQQNAQRPKKKILKKSPRKEHAHNNIKQKQKQNKLMQQQLSPEHGMNERSSQTFVSTNVLRKSSPKNSYTQANILFVTPDNGKNQFQTSQLHLNSSGDNEERFLMGVSNQKEEAFNIVEKYDRLHEVYLQHLANAVETLTFMTAVGIKLNMCVYIQFPVIECCFFW